MNHLQWLTEKPDFTEECIVICAFKIRGKWEYNIFLIKKVDSDEGWYMGWLTIDGDEYDDLDNLTAQMYFTIPLLK